MAEYFRSHGMVIHFYFFDTQKHQKPHFHLYAGGNEASISLDGELLAGRITKAHYKLIRELLSNYHAEFYEAWENAKIGKSFEKLTF